MNGKIAKMFDEITNSNVPVVLCSDLTIELAQTAEGLVGYAVLQENLNKEMSIDFSTRIDGLLASTCVFVAPKIKLPGIDDVVHISVPLINNHESARFSVYFNNVSMTAFVEFATTNDYSEMVLNVYLYI